MPLRRQAAIVAGLAFAIKAAVTAVDRGEAASPRPRVAATGVATAN